MRPSCSSGRHGAPGLTCPPRGGRRDCYLAVSLTPSTILLGRQHRQGMRVGAQDKARGPSLVIVAYPSLRAVAPDRARMRALTLRFEPWERAHPGPHMFMSPVRAVAAARQGLARFAPDGDHEDFEPGIFKPIWAGWGQYGLDHQPSGSPWRPCPGFPIPIFLIDLYRRCDPRGSAVVTRRTLQLPARRMAGGLFRCIEISTLRQRGY